MTLFTTSIRLINASIKGAITGAKDAVILEKQFMAWESELEVMEIFDGYEGWINEENGCAECDRTISWEEFVCTKCANEMERYDVQHADIVSTDDELPDFLKEDEYEDFNIFELDGASSCVKHKQFHDPYAGCHTCYEKSSYHMDNCSVEATGTCDCELPF